MKVSEIFLSCQGEGPDSGVPAVFLRLQGCNQACSWCDTKYALGAGGLDLSMGKVASSIKLLARDSKAGLLVTTGGEPLLQEKEVGELVRYLRYYFRFAVETNGTLPRPVWWKRVTWDVDRKCPSSGVSCFDSSWLAIGEKNRVKFVVSDEEDLDFVVSALPEFKGPLEPTLLVSPVLPREEQGGDWMTGGEVCMVNRRWLQRVWFFCMEHNLRFSLQQHKVVFGDKRGV